MKKFNLLYLFLGLSAFIYVFLRAIYVDVTFDEAWTIKDFVSQSSMDIISFKSCDANNHMLNTLSIKLFQNLLGDSLFVARIPSLLAFILYLYFSFKISSRFLNKYCGVLLFIGLIANPFLLEFFGLARGYGLAIGFMMASVYYLLDFLQTFRIRTGLGSLIFASFAVLSNFPLINYWLAVFFIIQLSFFLVKKKHFFKLLGFNFINLILLIALIYEPIRKLIVNGNLYFGGHDDFYNDTLISLTASSTNLPDDGIVPTILVGFIILTVIVIFSSSYRNFRGTSFFADPRKVLTLLLFLPILATIVQYYLFDSLYLIDRVALPFYPLIILFVFFWGSSSASVYSEKINRICITLLVSALLVNQYQNSNLYKTMTWEFDSRSEQVVSFLNEINSRENEEIILDSSWPFKSSITYYLNKKPKTKTRYLWDSVCHLEGKPNYFLYFGKPIRRHPDFLKFNEVRGVISDTLLAFPDERIYLFKLK